MSERLTPEQLALELMERYRNDGSCEREIMSALMERDTLRAQLEAVKAEIQGDANFGKTVELLFYRPLRQAEADNLALRARCKQLEADKALLDWDLYT